MNGCGITLILNAYVMRWMRATHKHTKGKDQLNSISIHCWKVLEIQAFLISNKSKESLLHAAYYCIRTYMSILLEECMVSALLLYKTEGLLLICD